MRVLVLYATRRNSTAEVAKYIANILQEAQLDVTTANVETFVGDMADYDAYVIGTGIYSGMWSHPLLDKLRQSKAAIGRKPLWGFGLCIRILEEGGEEYALKNYMPEFLILHLNLQEFRFFAGKFHLQDIDMQDRWTVSIRYDGITPPEHYNKDYREWETIGAWGHKIAADMLQVVND
jgi:menaquinone-dependent protoporphyrinogen oxidase